MSGGEAPPRTLVCVDSSVAFKWFCSENESSIDEALTLLADHQEGRSLIAAPPHMPAEVLNGLHHRLTSMEVAHLAAALGGMDILYHGWSSELLVDATALATRHNLTVHDALFPALAVLLDCELVTADRAQARVTECPVRLLR
jgi:predicted nucleic acid-binding protein